MASKDQEKNQDKVEMLKEEASKDQIKQFIRSYELKQGAIRQLVGIYANHALQPSFFSTLKAALALLVIPPLTNIYYTIRPNSILAGVMPYAVPLLCLSNYIYFLNKDFKTYCFTQQPDAENVRKQYQILFSLSYFDRNENQFMKKLENYRNQQTKGQEDSLE